MAQGPGKKRNEAKRVSLRHRQLPRAAATGAANSPTQGQAMQFLYQCLNAALPTLPALLASLEPAVINCVRSEQSRECYPGDVDWLGQNGLHHLPPDLAPPAPVHSAQLALRNANDPRETENLD